MTDEKKQNQEVQDYGQVLLSWRFAEFPSYERNTGWYIWGGIILIIFLIFSIWTSNFLFALITVMIAMTVLLFQRNNGQVQFEITEDGILLNKKFYSYEVLKNFYIIYQPPEVKTLYFEPKALLQPRIPISLEDQDPVKVREILLQYLEEDLDQEDEPLSDFFSRLFKL